MREIGGLASHKLVLAYSLQCRRPLEGIADICRQGVPVFVSIIRQCTVVYLCFPRQLYCIVEMESHTGPSPKAYGHLRKTGQATATCWITDPKTNDPRLITVRR